MKTIRLASGEAAQVDDIDSDLCKLKWRFHDGYALREENEISISLHRVVYNRMYPNSFPELVDHKDRNRLNCVRSNLRSCDYTQSRANSGISSTNTTGYKGVCFCKRRNKHVANITYYGRRIYLGVFDTADQAALAYNNAALRLFKDFASLNMIPGI